jgi:hypothetical protein
MTVIAIPRDLDRISAHLDFADLPRDRTKMI